MDLPLIIGIITTLILSGFFSGMEIAFVSSNRMRAEIDKENKSISTKFIDFFYRHPNGFVSTMLVGNNIVLVIYGILTAQLLDNTIFKGFDAGLRVTLDTIVSTILVIFVGEFIPKTIFKNNPNSKLSFFSLPAYLFYCLLWPISKITTFLSKVVLKILGKKLEHTPDDGEFTKLDLDYLVQSSIDNAKGDSDMVEEVKIFHNVLDLSDTRVRDCMIPRTEINAIDIKTCTDQELMQRFTESGHSKIIVYKENIDNIIGYIHSSEMFHRERDWRTRILEMPFVPETMAVKKLMSIFLQRKKSLGVVIDEFGGTSGLISLEDIVEEIFGEIEDEHDNKKYIAEQTEDGQYMLSARLEIDKVNEMFDLDIPESDDYMTIGGFILHHFQTFPKLNEIVNIDKYEFKIIKNTQTKIELVKLKVKQ